MDIYHNIGERRDALDQNWGEFLMLTGGLPIILPNNIKLVQYILNEIEFDGIVLSGGNTLYSYGGKAPERDIVDDYLIEHAIINKIPLLGVCRGMQSVVNYFGGILNRVGNHVKIDHAINGDITRVVNSYHNYGCDSLPDSLIVKARSEDGNVESINHNSLPILGIMWHPERGTVNKDDIFLIKSLWEKE